MTTIPRLPQFRRIQSLGGQLILRRSREAEAKKNKGPGGLSQPTEVVRREAIKAVEERNGDINNELDVKGEYVVQFGQYRGQSFRWILENDVGYASYIVTDMIMCKEKKSSNALSENKAAFKEYVMQFEDMRKQVEGRQRDRADRAARDQLKATPKSSAVKTPISALVSRLASGQTTPERFLARIKPGATTFKPNIPPARTPSVARPKPSAPPKVTATCTQSQPVSVEDKELCAIADQVERNLAPQVETMPQTSPQVPVPVQRPEQVPAPVEGPKQAVPETPKPTAKAIISRKSKQDHPLLPEGWRKSLPKADHSWVSQALFKISAKNGKAELDFSRANKLWWDPPQPPLISTQPPRPDKYFAQRLLLWMPRKLWKVKLYCPHKECQQKTELTSAGIYHNVRQVLDIDGNYNLAAEYLECKTCKRKVISWSPAIVKQLDPGHQLQFPVLLTYQYACDIRVIRLLRQRGLGNSSTQLQKKLTEEHSEKWLQRTMHYLTECKYFTSASNSGLLTCPSFEDPPKFMPVPKYRWLLTVYAQDIMNRIDHIKSSITSVFGRVIKMDSTKKIVRKLAGHSAGTASWATNIGNEKGQVLMSVMTASEGVGLGPMAAGLMRRYQMANVSPPEVLYVDRDCCGGACATKIKDLFSLWGDLIVRLDIWHLMRRFAAGCTTEAHPLYGVFLSHLSQAIFQWSKEDLALLKAAKRSEMQLRGIRDPSDEDIIDNVSRKELALHCRRKTRGIVETAELIYTLLTTFSGDQGCDTLGVPLLDKNRIWDIWNVQKHHIECIQDPVGVTLYTQTGTLTKGTVTLPTYRCARGSTSLESFHLHINRFVPGTSASDLHFQAYLLEGLSRWNADRAASAISGVTSSGPETYSGMLCQAVNELSEEVLGKPLKPNVQEAGIYTGELIGVEYLYNQTGQVLQDTSLEDGDSDQPVEEPLSDVDPDQLDEGFVDNDDETVAMVAEVYPMPDGSEKESDSTSDEDSAEDVSTELSREAEDSVGPDNVEGYGKVQALAEYLVSLTQCDMALTHSQATQIINLWNQMDDYDRRPTTFAARHRTQLVKGKFKTSKKRKSNVVPGLDSTKRCFLGADSGPAQWPDCNRYVEAVISKLCDIHPKPDRAKSPRWSLICKSYKGIRDRVVNNARVMRETDIQLVEINHTTLGQWYNNREKKKERDILKQGLRLPQPEATAKDPLPAAILLPPSLPQMNFPFPFTFNLPTNTTGMGRGKQFGPTPVPPPPPKQPNLVPSIFHRASTSATITTAAVGSSSFKEGEMSRSTYYYNKRKAETEETGAEPKKKYQPRSEKIKCRKCGQIRDAETHRQYYGNWYCQRMATETYENWRDDLKKAREEKKKTKE